MAKILLVQTQPVPLVGTAYLSSAAKSANHQLSLVVSNRLKVILETIQCSQPDIIGFSCMSSLMSEMLEIAASIKEHFDIPILLGGPHPTLFPEVINEPAIDMICRGEGEFPLIELLDAFELRKPFSSIQNLWVKQCGQIHKNPLRPLADPLDRVPLIDWSCYNDTNILKLSPPIVFPIRGCPYSCSYCFNQTTRDLYRGLGTYVRHLSVERAVEELKEALKYFSSGPVLFNSDSFGIDLDWMDNFFHEYSRVTSLPFVVLLRPELASEKCIAILAKYKCWSVAIGVEAGSERVRKEILNRNYSNADLLNVADRLHRHNIKFRTYNMLGLPTETEDERQETIDLNIKMKTDFPRGAIFTPMPGTRIVDIAKKFNCLDDSFSFATIPKTIFNGTVLKGSDRDTISNTLYLFQSAVLFPRLRNIFKRLTHRKPNFLYRVIFYVFYAYLHKKSEKRPLLAYIRYVLMNRDYV